MAEINILKPSLVVGCNACPKSVLMIQFSGPSLLMADAISSDGISGSKQRHPNNSRTQICRNFHGTRIQAA